MAAPPLPSNGNGADAGDGLPAGSREPVLVAIAATAPLLVDVDGLARLLGVSRRTVERMDAAAALGVEPVYLAGREGKRIKRYAVHGPRGVQAWIDAGCPDRAAWRRARS